MDLLILLTCTALVCTVSSGESSGSGVLSPAAPDRQSRKTEVCYDHVGCFNHNPPFHDPNFGLPLSPEKIGTTFKLFTRRDGKVNGTFFNYTDITTLKNSRYNPNLKTKFVTHGFSNDIKSEWPYEMKDELLKSGDFNVITVAWGPGAAFPDYMQAVANTRVLANQIELVLRLMVQLGTPYSNIHLIGHSLGAHTSGQVGQALKAKQLTLARITGLDPAEPNYKDHPKAMRLDKHDAAFVDVIHTNGAPFWQGGAGLFEPCGDVDFYVNGGKVQPDCNTNIFGMLGSILQGRKNASSVAESASCSHSRSHTVFTESINSDCPFTAYPCSNYVNFQNGDCLSCGEQGCGMMGYHSDWYSATGMMFLNTRYSQPFCGHHYAMKAKVSSKSTDTKGALEVQLFGTWGHSEWMPITTKKDVIPPGGRLNSVEVTKGIIGLVKTAKVRYTKSGWLNTDKIKMEKITILSGESGKQYLLCFNSTLVSGHIQTIRVSEQMQTCP